MDARRVLAARAGHPGDPAPDRAEIRPVLRQSERVGIRPVAADQQHRVAPNGAAHVQRPLGPAQAAALDEAADCRSLGVAGGVAPHLDVRRRRVAEPQRDRQADQLPGRLRQVGEPQRHSGRARPGAAVLVPVAAEAAVPGVHLADANRRPAADLAGRVAHGVVRDARHHRAARADRRVAGGVEDVEQVGAPAACRALRRRPAVAQRVAAQERADSRLVPTAVDGGRLHLGHEVLPRAPGPGR